jgi:predicted HicB family RNase H-like nuclease
VATSRKKHAGEATDRIKLTVEITPQLRERLYAYTAKTGVKLRFLVEKALEEYLNRVGA